MRAGQITLKNMCVGFWRREKKCLSEGVIKTLWKRLPFVDWQTYIKSMYQLSPQSPIYISFYSLSLFSLQIKGIYIILELLVAFLAVNPCLFWALIYLLALARLVTEPVVWVAAGQTHSWKIQNNRIRTHMAEVGPPSFGDRLIKHTGTSYYPP